jgi:O-antigen ligase
MCLLYAGIAAWSNPLILQRFASMSDLNDFSWRNRVSAWIGCLQMVGDKPWFGFGWNQPELISTALFSQATGRAAMPVHLNDFLLIASSTGIFSLLFFCLYIHGIIYVATKDVSEDVELSLERILALQIVYCLLFIFLMDGGLFKCPLAIPFWLFLEAIKTSAPLRRKTPQSI